MVRDTPQALLPSVLFALILAFDVFHAVIHVNRLSYWSQDSLTIATAAILLIALPAAAGFFVLIRLLAGFVKNGPRAALGVAMAGVLAYFLTVAATEPSEISTFLRLHLGFACFLVAACLIPWRSSRTTLALLGAFAVGITATVAASGGNVAYESVIEDVENLRVSPVPFGGRILLLGVDGLCWETLQRWAEEHPSEDWEWFRERAFRAPPDDHGVIGFTSWDYKGLEHSRLVAPRFEGSFYWNRVLPQVGLGRLMTVSSLDMKRPPVWEIVGRGNYPVDVLAWWATWPAQSLPGRLVSDRFYFSRSSEGMDLEGNGDGATSPPSPAAGHDPAGSLAGLTFPPHLESDLAPLRRAPEEMTEDELLRFLNPPPDQEQTAPSGLAPQGYDPRTELRYGYTSDETWFAIANRFLDNAPLNVTMAAYFRGVDMISHGCLRFSHLYPEADQANRESGFLYGEIVCRYYDYAFSQLRKLIEKAGDNTQVLIVSDHGFEHMGEGQFGHYHAPQGVFMALGAGRTGSDTTSSYHVYDIAPTLLWLRGYPASEDMPGRAHDELYPQLRGGERPSLATYGYRLATPGDALGNAQTDEEMMRLLKTLGYVK
jgi:hypothetical protein